MARDDPAPACGPEQETGETGVAMDDPAQEAAGARPGKALAVMRVCSLLSVKLRSRGC